MLDIPSVLISLLLFSIIVFFIRGAPKSKSIQFETLTEKIGDQEKKINEQSVTIYNLESLYRSSIMEIGDRNRNDRQQAQLISSLRERIRELENMVGVKSKIVGVLGVWPYERTELNTLMEEMAIYNAGFEYKRLRQSYATRSNVLRDLRRPGIQIVEVGTHGKDSTINLYDGETSPGWWIRAIESTDVHLMVLMVCESESVGDALVRAGVPYVVSVQEKIPDKDAVVFVKNFYERLAETGIEEYSDIKSAYDYARLSVDHDSSTMIIFSSKGG